VGEIVVQKNASILWGLLLLRLGLGIYLILWALDKVIEPELTVKMWAQTHFLEISPTIAILTGAFVLVLSLLFILALYKTITYGIAWGLHSLWLLFHYQYLFAPFGPNNLIIASIPVFFAFAALFILREFDTKLSLGKRKSLFA
jgi:putative oxidoreductase